MRIAKPLMLISTPIGVVAGIREAWRFHPILAVLMAGLIAVIGLFIFWTVRTIKRESQRKPGL
jgi:nitrate reductase gamma subunit